MPTIGEIRRNNNKQCIVWNTCSECGKERWVRVVKNQLRFKLCKSCSHMVKSFGYAWKGGRIKEAKGYIKIWLSPTDFFFPMANKKKGQKGGYLQEHRLVMAKHLNRCLLSWEVVHHKNGIKDDNRLENLQLLPEGKYHLVDARIKYEVKRLTTKVNKQDEEIHLLQQKVLLLEAENIVLRVGDSQRGIFTE